MTTRPTTAAVAERIRSTLVLTVVRSAMQITRRNLISAAAGLAVLAPTRLAWAQAATSGPDRVFICNEDSNTLAVIDPATNTVSATINLTSFDEDPRPPFRYVTGGVVPAHVAMVR